MAPRPILRLVRRALPLALLVAGLTAAPAAAVQLGPEPAHSPNAEDIALTYWVLMVIVVVLIVGANAALLAALVRFRERRGRVASRVTAGRGVIPRLTGAFSVLALGVFVFGVVMTDSARTVEESGPEGLSAAAARTAQVGVKGVPAAVATASEQTAQGEEPTGGETPVVVPEAGQPLEISAIAQQWLWRFEYPGGVPGDRTFSYGQLVVPVDTAVVLNITSTDVIHSWWIPSLGGQVEAIPGSVSRTWFKADEVGIYEGSGTIFDGTSYPAMRPSVRVVDATEFQSYVEGLAADLDEAQRSVEEEVSAAAEAEAQAAPAEEGE